MVADQTVKAILLKLSGKISKKEWLNLSAQSGSEFQNVSAQEIPVNFSMLSVQNNYNQQAWQKLKKNKAAITFV